jgi:hypothetical protein
MKHHDGRKRINKVDGGKARAKKQYHKKLRTANLAELPEPDSMYWEGEDGEGYKEDGCPWIFNEEELVD